ncbi:MAG: hypothetical protein LBR89_03290 [Holosporales bacterium]|jgi:hypothetical protein|nr:hypothetical protein [Holosporales bacterium]
MIEYTWFLSNILLLFLEISTYLDEFFLVNMKSLLALSTFVMGGALNLHAQQRHAAMRAKQRPAGHRLAAMRTQQRPVTMRAKRDPVVMHESDVCPSSYGDGDVVSISPDFEMAVLRLHSGLLALFVLDTNLQAADAVHQTALAKTQLAETKEQMCDKMRQVGDLMHGVAGSVRRFTSSATQDDKLTSFIHDCGLTADAALSLADYAYQEAVAARQEADEYNQSVENTRLDNATRRLKINKCIKKDVAELQEFYPDILLPDAVLAPSVDRITILCRYIDIMDVNRALSTDNVSSLSRTDLVRFLTFVLAIARTIDISEAEA